MGQHDEVHPTRRALLCAACAAPLVAACGGSESGAEKVTSGAPTGSPPSAAPTGTGSVEPSPSTTAPSSPRTPGSAPSTKTPDGRATPSASASGSPAGTRATANATESSPTPAPAPPPPGALVKTSAVPVGGGVVISAKGIVVTQPSAGTFRGFSSTCTHQGCSVDRISGGSIVCPCHGSEFSVVDGSVTRKPAIKPLSSRAVTVRSGWVCTA